MAVLHMSFSSAALDFTTDVNVIMPQKDAGTPPRVLYLLHGYHGSEGDWLRYTGIERYADGHNLAVVMPAGYNQFYQNAVHGIRCWDYISKELPEVVQRMLRVSDRPEDTYAAGLSMGGYGAMRLALTYPERYAAAASFSGAVDIHQRANCEGARPFVRALFEDPDHVRGTDSDLFVQLQKNAQAPHRPKLFVACGLDDFLLPAHRAFVPALKENGWETEVYEEPGVGHEWRFWDETVKMFIEKYIPAV